jgi:hypothetical protein
MQIEVTMKTPDALMDAINDALSVVEDEEIRQEKEAALEELCKKWFQYGEYVTLIIDTDKQTCTVKERS